MKMAPEWFENWIDRFEGRERKMVCFFLFNVLPCAVLMFILYRCS